MSRLVTSSPHSGSTTVSPAAVSSFSILPKSRNSSSYLTVPRPLTIATTRVPASSGLSARSLRDEQFGQFRGGGHRVLGDARFAVDAQAQGHLSRGDREQRRVGSRQGAAVERHAEGPGAVVGPDGQPFDVVQVQPGFGGGAGDLEDRQVAGDAAALLDLVQRGAGDVVGDQDGAGLDAFGVEAQLGLAEVQDVAGVVAVAQQHAAAGVGGLGHPVDLAGRGRGEHVAAGRGRRPGPVPRVRRRPGSARSRRRPPGRPARPGPRWSGRRRRRHGQRSRGWPPQSRPVPHPRNQRDCRRSGSWFLIESVLEN